MIISLMNFLLLWIRRYRRFTSWRRSVNLIVFSVNTILSTEPVSSRQCVQEFCFLVLKYHGFKKHFGITVHFYDVYRFEEVFNGWNWLVINQACLNEKAPYIIQYSINLKRNKYRGNKISNKVHSSHETHFLKY